MSIKVEKKAGTIPRQRGEGHYLDIRREFVFDEKVSGG